MIEPRPPGSAGASGTERVGVDVAADRHACDAEPLPPAVIGLHEDADRVAAVPPAHTRDAVPIRP